MKLCSICIGAFTRWIDARIRAHRYGRDRATSPKEIARHDSLVAAFQAVREELCGRSLEVTPTPKVRVVRKEAPRGSSPRQLG